MFEKLKSAPAGAALTEILQRKKLTREQQIQVLENRREILVRCMKTFSQKTLGQLACLDSGDGFYHELHKDNPRIISSDNKNKKPSVMVASMKSIQKKVAVTTWTMDNGTENQWHEQFGLPTYFCTPGSPWQKPHVESSIGLVRRWFLPKGTDLAKVPDETFQSILFTLNHKYRKSLGYRSAYEVALECDIIKKVPQLSKRKAIAFR